AAAQYQGRLTIAKLNVDENPDSAAKYGIRGIPTLMLFKNGQVAATKVGALSRTQLQAFLDEALCFFPSPTHCCDRLIPRANPVPGSPAIRRPSLARKSTRL